MSRTTRLWLLVAPAGLVVGAAASALMLFSDHQDVPRLQAVLTALTGGSFITAGLIARTRRPLNRTGLLLIAVGFTWFVSTGLLGANDSLLWTIGVSLSAVPAGFLIHLLIAYPSGRLHSRWDLAVVLTGYGLVTVAHAAHLPVDADPYSCGSCPDNAFLVRDDETLRNVAVWSVQFVAVAYLLAVVVTLIGRWRHSSPAARRALAPVLLAGAATLLLFAISVGAQPFSQTVSDVSGWTAMFVLIGVPFLFLWGLLQSRLARADISRALAEGTAGGVQERVRQLLRDPTAELLYACADPPGGYVDVNGRPREAVAEPGRAVTPIEREGRSLAAIVHDEALLEEPELLEQLAAAVGLEVERDQNLFALQASERRSRALLEAIPDSMFRIGRDGRIRDFRVEPPIRLFRSAEDIIGSDVYEGDFPREITARSMALGEKALSTGELQMHEYEVEVDGEVQHQEARIARSGSDEFLVIIRDVTERKRQEQELLTSERRSRALLHALPDKMFRVSGDGVILDIQENPDLSPPPVRSKVGSSVYDGPVPREHIDRMMATGRRALETGELQTIEWDVDIEGDSRHAEGRFIPSGDNEFIVVIRDVTDRKRQEVEQAALHRVALAVASEGRPEQIFDLVSEEVGRVLGAHAARLVRFEPGGEEAFIAGGWHEPGALAYPVGSRYPMKGSASETVLTKGSPVRLELGDGKVSPELDEQMRALKVNSLVAAPITLGGSPWGAVVATITTPHSFPPGAEERLGAFTRLVSLALANEEAREQLAASRARLVSAGDEERRRLERNLHDGAQQRLVSLSLSLRLAQGKLASDPQAAKALLSSAGAELGVALEELRELARGIHPAVLTERGLGPALQTLADRAPLPVELELPQDERFPRRVEAAAYYVVSEALANVAKYARASACAVSICRADGLAVVEVADDGAGGADPQRGSGLRGLTDRIEALDGTLVVHSPAGGGTRIRAEIPCTSRTVSSWGLAALQNSGQHESQLETQL